MSIKTAHSQYVRFELKAESTTQPLIQHSDPGTSVLRLVISGLSPHFHHTYSDVFSSSPRYLQSTLRHKHQLGRWERGKVLYPPHLQSWPEIPTDPNLPSRGRKFFARVRLLSEQGLALWKSAPQHRPGSNFQSGCLSIQGRGHCRLVSRRV